MARREPAKGNFASYSKGSGDADYPDDEVAVDAAIDNMFTMCGNPGQEAMVGDCLDDFYDWAIEILEERSAQRGTTWAEFKDIVLNEWYDGRLDKWAATDMIWAQGWSEIAEQSGYHDTEDEIGEGTGQEFAG